MNNFFRLLIVLIVVGLICFTRWKDNRSRGDIFLVYLTNFMLYPAILLTIFSIIDIKNFTELNILTRFIIYSPVLELLCHLSDKLTIYILHKHNKVWLWELKKDEIYVFVDKEGRHIFKFKYNEEEKIHYWDLRITIDENGKETTERYVYASFIYSNNIYNPSKEDIELYRFYS